MAANNMKAVKLRMKSIQNTMQITKAMELVAASKLRKAKDRAVAIGPTLDVMFGSLQRIAEENRDFQSKYSRPAKDGGKYLYVVIAGDRGLAGGYNSNLFKHFEECRKDQNYAVIPVGKKAYEYFA